MNPHLPQCSRELSNTSSFNCVLSIIHLPIAYEFVLSMNNEYFHQCRGISTTLAPFSGHLLITIMWISEQDSCAHELGCFHVSVVYLTIFILNFLPQLHSTDNPQIRVRKGAFLAEQEEISGMQFLLICTLQFNLHWCWKDSL